ncbi:MULTISPECIES: GNAT family N-acetyltransferase [Streptomyces]|uniref:GNAT family N-acetyltransferase n=1 Tax=Streptomyces griseiscabiei TaxID=2993540 RepID=A0ABU4LDW4_9ACTN|nr:MULTISPECIES: GNAT family N-acetyltransferase [Streptomyces]MBZ3908452.1 GNAT family N-acetyltransferase [Streptomyces griseiscabiei]MDX2913970.1 GNAT family N-acetyltransferase [Streptomyces griseiscabiei]
MSELTVSSAESADVTCIAELVAEIEQYYGGAVEGELSDRAGRLRDMLFGPHPAATVLLARIGGDVVGMASFSLLWPAAGDSHSLYLKELFVRDAHRRHGVASALMAQLHEVAAQLGCSRIEWTADRDNPEALKFYEALGATPRDTKVFYRQTVPPR